MPILRSNLLSPTRRLQLIIAVLAVVAAGLVAAPPSSAQDPETPPEPEPVLIVDPSATIQIDGSGWGHGVGMSQWGAYSRGLAGQSVDEILNFYYRDTELLGNYGRPGPGPTPNPTPTSQPTQVPLPTPPEGSVQVLLAAVDSTTLRPEGLNRVTVDNVNIPYDNQDAVRPPAGTDITFTRQDGLWHISYLGIDVCGAGCTGQTAQLHFATNTSVFVSDLGRSYSHGRFNLIADDQSPSRFDITLDYLTAGDYFNDQYNYLGTPPSEQTQPDDPVEVLLAATETTTLRPEGVNRVTIDNFNIPYNNQDGARAPAGTDITITRSQTRWTILFDGTDICGAGCYGQTVQLLFATGSSVSVSNTGRSYSHGRINLMADTTNQTRFLVILDSLTVDKYLTDPHNDVPELVFDPPDPTNPTDPEPGPPPEPVHSEDAIRVHLSTATGTTLTPHGENRITIDGQGEIRVPPGTPVTFARHADNWHVSFSGSDACGAGCHGQTAQLHFATGTSVSVSNTGRSYSHGRINLVPTGGEPNEFYVTLDTLSMEQYMRGIAEVPMDWPSVAQQVQAIAARSYATATLRERRASPSWTRPFDLYSTLWDQTFVGDTREKHPNAGAWLLAVERTAGQVLFHNGAPIRAFYSSSNGGHTELSGYVFHANLPYLRAEPDEFDLHEENPNRFWQRGYTVEEFTRWLNDHTDTSVGRLIGMEVVGGAGTSGRLDKADIRITGTNRTITVTGSRLQSRINTAAQQSSRPQLLSSKFSFAVPEPTVALEPGDPSQPPPEETSPTDPPFYSGVIDSPDFCLNFSLGGPVTYPHDSDDDGVADVCSLPRTRREAVAHQRALEQLALVHRDLFTARFAEECRSVAESFGEPDKEAFDKCQQYRDLPSSTVNVPDPSQPADVPTTEPQDPETPPDEMPAAEDDRLFYSGVIDGPDFCLNFSLGGPVTYPHDSDDDGVADVCSLPRTRREAVARQLALQHLPQISDELSTLFDAFFIVNCHSVPETLGEPEKEPLDKCAPYVGAEPV